MPALLLAVLLASAASAAAPAAPAAPKPENCLHPAGKKRHPPKTFEELKACQKKAKRALILAARKRRKPLTDDQLDAVDDVQREETRQFMATSHEVIGGGDGDADVPSAEPSGGKGPAEEAAQAAAPGGEDQMSDVPAEAQAATSDFKNRFTAAGVMPAPEDISAIQNAMMQTRGQVTPEINQLIDRIIQEHKHPAKP